MAHAFLTCLSLSPNTSTVPPSRYHSWLSSHLIWPIHPLRMKKHNSWEISYNKRNVLILTEVTVSLIYLCYQNSSYPSTYTKRLYSADHSTLTEFYNIKDFKMAFILNNKQKEINTQYFLIIVPVEKWTNWQQTYTFQSALNSTTYKICWYVTNAHKFALDLKQRMWKNGCLWIFHVLSFSDFAPCFLHGGS